MGFTTKIYRPVVGLPIVVRPLPGIPKIRRFATIVGIRPRYKLGVHNNSLENVMRGLTERVYRVEKGGELVEPPAPEPGAYDELAEFRDKLVRVTGRLQPWGYEEFILSCRGSKRQLYQQAVDSLQHSPLSLDDARLCTFVKAEKLDLESKPDPAPRLIQPRSPRYNAWVGRYLKAAEHRIYSAIDQVWGSPTVMSGYNSVDLARHLRAMWDTFSDPVAVGLDASRFDQHVSVDALRWEHGIYNATYRDKALAAVLEWQIHNKGTARTPDGIVKYQVEGKRMSGDMNTSLGNKLIVCGLVWEYCRQRNVRAKLANNGDDCVVFMARGQLQRFQQGLTEWFLRFGFNMKVEEPAYEFEHIEFCQQRPVNTGPHWVMTRSPFKGLAKDVTMIGVNPNAVARDYKDWAGGVGVAGLAAYGGIPVVQEMYLRMSELGKGKRSDLNPYSGLGGAARGAGRSYQPPSAVCRASYYLAWGITPHMQVIMERLIRGADLNLEQPWLIDQVDHLAI